MKKLVFYVVWCASSLIALEPPLKKQKVSEQDFFEYLPAEIKEQVAVAFARSPQIEDGVSSLLTLMQTNRSWNEFLNDVGVTNTLIQIISQKYQVSSVVAAAQLGTRGAKSWLEQRLQQHRFATTVMLKSSLLYMLGKGELQRGFNRRAILWLLAHNALFDPEHVVHLDNGNSAYITKQTGGEYILFIFSRTGDEVARVSLPNTKNVKHLSSRLAANSQHIIVTIFSSQSIASSYLASFKLDGTVNESFGTQGIASLDIPLIHEEEIYELLAVTIEQSGTITLSCTDDIDQPISLFFAPNGALDNSTEEGSLSFSDIDNRHELYADSFRSIKQQDYLICSGIERSRNQLYINRTILNHDNPTNFFIVARSYIRQSTVNEAEYALLSTPRAKVVVHASYESNKSHHELKLMSFNSSNGETHSAAFTRWADRWTDSTPLYQDLSRANDLESSAQAIDRWLKSDKAINAMIKKDPSHLKWLTADLVERDQLFPESMPRSQQIREALIYASIPEAHDLLATISDQVAQETLRHTIAYEIGAKKTIGKLSRYHGANRVLMNRLIAKKKPIGPNFDTDHAHQIFLTTDDGFGVQAFSSGQSPISISDYSKAHLIATFGANGVVTVPKVSPGYRATALYLDGRSQVITIAGSHNDSVVTAQIDASTGKITRGQTMFQIADTKLRIEGITSTHNNMLLLWGRTTFFGKEYLILINVSAQGIYKTHELIPLDTLLKE